MRKVIGIILTVIVFSFVSCTKAPGSSSPYVPTVADVTANATLTQLQQGRTLFINNCGLCHSLPNPDDYSVSGWNSILSNMAPKTTMSSTEVTIVTKYVTRGAE